MLTLPIKQKCVMYITHRSADQQQRLLVFDHQNVPEAGTQVPAGTLRYGELAETAALREAQEETGLTNLRVDGLLGERFVDLTPYGTPEIQRRFFYHLICEDATVEARWSHSETDPSDGSTEPIPFDLYWVDLKAEALPVLRAEQGDLLTELVKKLG